jgi:hypothetical protein
MRRLLILGCIGTFAACGDDASSPDAGGGVRDGGATVDSGGGTDGGPGTDTGTLPACALPEPFDTGATYATTLHVATTGDDSNDGSESSPLATLGEAASRATPGTRILLHAGTYTGSTYLEIAGEPGRPIAIVGEGMVVLDAEGAAEVLHLVEARHLVLENLSFTGSTTNGVNVDDGGSYDTPAEHVVFRNIRIYGTGSGGNNDCLKLSGLDRFHVIDSDFTDCDAGDAIDMVGCHDGVIHGNAFHQTLGSGGIQAKGGSADVIIHGNTFTDVNARGVNAGGSTGLEFFRPIDAPHEAARIHVVANVIVRPGENSGAPIAYVGCDACVFAHNTVVEPRTWIARILQESTDARFVPSRDGLYVNNLIVLNVGALRGGVFVNVGAGTAPETFTFGNNLWFALDRDDTWTGPALPDPIPPETGSVVQMDPLLVDRDADDYHLQPGSPAIAAGRALTGPPFPDFDGRCYAAPPAAGAFAAP